MEDIDSHLLQHTPPPSPYHETNWALNLDQANNALLNPKEKKLGYLELYFQGFMEFVDEPPTPDMSDDETEYPRWGSISSPMNEPPPPSRSLPKSALRREPSIAREFSKQIIYSTSHDTAHANRNARIPEYPEPSMSQPSLLSTSQFALQSPSCLRQRKHETRRSNVIGKIRLNKQHRPSTHAIRKRVRPIPRRRSSRDSITSMR